MAYMYDKGYDLNKIVTPTTISGILIISTGEIIWSAHRHDFSWNDTEEYFIDGGRDYVRSNVMSDTQGVTVSVDLENRTFKRRTGAQPQPFELRATPDHEPTGEEDM